MEYSKHFDCVAEPLTNYIRHKIYGFERHICQYSNMVRRNEITREQALNLYANDKIECKPSNCNNILEYLGVTADELTKVESIKPLIYENKTSKVDQLFLHLVRLKQQFM